MKLLFSSLLLAFAAAEQERGLQQQYSNGGDLFARWDMTEPDIDYDSETDIFTFKFLTASSANYDDGLEETFWNEDCMPAESSATGFPIIAPLIQSVSNHLELPELVMVDNIPEMKFKIDAAEFADEDIERTFSEINGVTTIKFCIRSSLGYTLLPGPASPTNYQEVNFIETLVEVEYDMSSGFTVEAFSVAPKVRELTTISESYEDALFAYLCVGAQNPDYNGGATNELINLANGEEYKRPIAVTSYNLIDGPYENVALGLDCSTINSGIVNYPDICSVNTPATPMISLTDLTGINNDCKACGGGVTNPNGDAFNQGSLINVCVAVKDEFAAQDIVIDEILTFSWSRTGGSTFNQDVSGGGDESSTINQPAIVGGNPAGNYLTSYDSSQCNNEYWCDFASVLFAAFYNTDGEVSGAGDATLQFKTRRNRRALGESNGRALQEDPGSAGMDISIDVNGEVEGPGDLKTAGGASLGATALGSAIAFVGAALLA